MPCWTLMTAETDPGKMLGEPLIHALTELGLQPSHSRVGIIDFDGGYYQISDGSLHFKGQLATRAQQTTEIIQTQYATSVVKLTAKKHGWTLKEKEKNKFVIIKR